MSEKTAKEARRQEEEKTIIARYDIIVTLKGDIIVNGGPNNLVVFLDTINKASMMMLNKFGTEQAVVVAEYLEKQREKSPLILPKESKIIIPGH